MNNDKDQALDVAVIGAGISGLYAAWRLSGNEGVNPSRIAIFEGTDRIGGRLWSVGLRSEESIPAELGGMFFSDTQTLLYDLVTRKLGLKTTKVIPEPDFAYLRGNRFRISEFNNPDIVPYNLKEDEEGVSYHQLLFIALERIIPDLKDHWPLNSSGTYTELIHHLRKSHFEGRPLHHWGFWNLLSKVLSNEAYICLRDLVGSYAFFSNWNALDASLSLLENLNGSWHKLPDGYQKLPETLADQVKELGIPINRNCHLTQISDGPNDLHSLEFHEEGNIRHVLARQIILAIPRHPLTELAQRVEFLQDPETLADLSAVESVPACKIFLTFDEPWWRRVPEGPGRISESEFAVSHTDLPMRQCYYLGVDPDTQDGLVLASYSDAQSVPFWSTLMTNGGRQSDLTCDVPQAAREEIRRQLSEMHGIDVPEPKAGIFVNWSCPPYGAGWHSWLPGWESYKVMSRLRDIADGHGVYVCGEAFSAYQGWVEGALTSTEVLLQQKFSMKAPEWLNSSECLAPYYP